MYILHRLHSALTEILMKPTTSFIPMIEPIERPNIVCARAKFACGAHLFRLDFMRISTQQNSFHFSSFLFSILHLWVCVFVPDEVAVRRLR